MTRSTKRWLILLGIPLLLVAGGSVALKLILTGERLREMILPGWRPPSAGPSPSVTFPFPSSLRWRFGSTA